MKVKVVSLQKLRHVVKHLSGSSAESQGPEASGSVSGSHIQSRTVAKQ